MGVSMALRKLDREAEAAQGSVLYTLGPIIHNPQVLEDYEQRGVRRIGDPDEAEAGGRVVIRAHGVSAAVERRLRERGVKVVDATCPKVKKAQVLIAEQARRGGRLLLFGEEGHPEVKGLRSYGGEDTLVFDSLEQLRSEPLETDVRYFVAAQTTQDRQAFAQVVAYLLNRLGRELPVLDTICDATRKRQDEAVRLARQVPAMVVVGGFNSGNTRRLADVVRDQGAYCVHVETPEQLPLDELRRFDAVGVTAGASTPIRIVDAVQAVLEALSCDGPGEDAR